MDVLWWLFESLEKRIRRGPREHVGFVQDVDPTRPRDRSHRSDVDADLPDVLNLVVAGGVELDHIERGSLGYRDA